MAGQLRVLVRLARAAAVAAAVMPVSVAVSGAGPAWAAAGARPFAGQVGSVWCASAGRCAAVGYVEFLGDEPDRPLVVSEKNGAWGSAGTVPGLSALPGGDQGAFLGPVSCSPAGNCTAGGFYQQSDADQGLVVTETGGVWGPAKPVPGLAALNKGGDAEVDEMSCRSAGDCTASGIYSPNDDDFQVFVVSETNGTWGPAEPIRGLAALGDHDAGVELLSCGSPGNCSVAGSYETTGGSEAFAATQQNGAWSRVHTFPAIAAVTREAEIDALSCRPGGRCTAAGGYRTPRGIAVFAVSQTRGTWGAPRLIPGLAAGSGSFNLALSCPSPGNCTLGGAYGRQGDGAALFTAAENNGAWGQARPMPGLAALNTGKNAILEGLVCFSAGTCTAAGNYTIARKHDTAAIFVTAEKNGTWGTPQRVPGSLVNLGTNISLVALSCGAPGYCSIGGYYHNKFNDEPFLATQKHGTWGKAQHIRGIQP